MPDTDTTLEARIADLEHQVARLREQAATAVFDSAAARARATDVDHEVTEVRAELRAHTLAINALETAQLEQGVVLRKLRQEVADGFSALNNAMAQITALLTRDTDSGQD